MGKYILDPCIEDELWFIWKFIAKNNRDAATRVVEAAYETFKVLAANPELGTKRFIPKSPAQNIRYWRISGFNNYLIFYRILSDGIQVLHVYHGARNIDALLRRLPRL